MVTLTCYSLVREEPDGGLTHYYPVPQQPNSKYCIANIPWIMCGIEVTAFKVFSTFLDKNFESPYTG